MKIQIPKLPDYSKYLNKTLVFLEDFQTDSNIRYCKGIKFRIIKIKNNYVTIKAVSTMAECEPSIQHLNNVIIRDLKKDIKILDWTLHLWETEKDKFRKKKTSMSAPDDSNEHRGGRCINTGYYNIPKNHPDKYGMAATSRHSNFPDDSIMTLDYERTDGLKNKYSYQKEDNEWYSLDCYKYIRLSHVQELEEREKLLPKIRKTLYSWIKEKQETTIDKLNKGKYELHTP